MHFESSWIVWLKDTAAALMSGTVCDHEEVKNVIVASPPLISTTIILSTDFTITFPFVLPSQIKTLKRSYAEEGTHWHIRACCLHFSQSDVFVSLTTHQRIVHYWKWYDALQPWVKTKVYDQTVLTGKVWIYFNYMQGGKNNVTFQ